MPYDKSKDKNVFEKEVSIDDKNSIVVAVYQYEDGEPKLQLNKKFISKSGGSVFLRIGRLSLSDMKNILPFIQEAMKFMGKKKI